MNKTQQALATAVQAVKNADSAVRTFNGLSNEIVKAQELAVSAVEIACAESYGASLAGVSGADIARESGVSEMTVSRYIAGGKIAHQTDNKVTGSKAVSDMGNGYIGVTEVKNCENVSQYNKAVKAGKDKNKNGAGKAESRSPIEVATAHLEQVTKAIKAGKIELQEIVNIWAEMVASLEVETEDAEEMEDAEI
jgi:hypothetical protein